MKNATLNRRSLPTAENLARLANNGVSIAVLAKLLKVSVRAARQAR